VLVDDVAAAGFDQELEAVFRKEGIGAVAFVPLVRGGRLLGRFMLYRDARHTWSDREVLLSRTVANHLASVAERTQAQEAMRESSHEAEESRSRLALLLEATEQLSQTLDYEELLRRVPQLVVPRIADG
jgi:GAF domain-containing protein